MPKRMTHEEFVANLAIQHPNLEVLSKYNGNKNYVTVRCKIHDYTFNTKPNWLKHGQGCQKCYDDRRGNTTRKTTEQFIAEAKEIHGDKYDYSKVEYIGNKTKVCIICPIHGEFWMTPNKHLSQKQGCPKCACIQNGLNKRLKQEDFVEKASKIHHYRYDYTLTKYIRSNENIQYLCPIHGLITQNASVHLSGCGCPLCNASRLELDVEHLLKENNIEYVRQYKFTELGRQSLDFYLPQYKLGIECQGGQHLFAVDHFGGEHGFEVTVERDEKKYDVCKDYNISLLYIFPNNLKAKLSQEFTKENSIYSQDNSLILEDIKDISEILSKSNTSKEL